MKKIVIVSLVCVNLALLAAIVLGAYSPQARAQSAEGWRKTDYIMFTGTINTDTDGVYIIDLASQKLGAWKFDITNKRLTAYRWRELDKDFRKKGI